MTPAFPERIGNYRVVREIGEGGMGVVYEALEELSGRRVALKVLHANLARSPDARARFFNEMRIMASFEHPNVARSLASFEVDGKLVLVLELYDGRTLRDELEAAGPLPPNRTLAIALAIASALCGAHERPEPIVHRDLKPENVMLLSDGSVRVMDFGIAKVLGGGGGNLTQASQAVGTVVYMSPEQAESRGVTPLTDLYALGLVIYEMLAGKPPFDGPSIMGVLRAHCETPAPPLPDAVKRVAPPDLERLILALLEKQPEHRPPGARFVLGELHRIAVGGMAASGFVPVMQATGGVQAQARAAGKLDTYELVARFDKKRAVPWRWVAIVVAVLLGGAAIASAVVFWSSTPSKKKSKQTSDSAEVESSSAPIAAPSATTPSCGGALGCAPLAMPDPANVDFELVLAEATKLARSVDPTATLWSISRLQMKNPPALDYSTPKRVTIVHFDTPTSDLSVSVRPGQLTASRTEIRKRPKLGPINCPFKRAFDVAVAGGFGARDIYDANLYVHPVNGASQWGFFTDDGNAQVDATTCKLFRKADPKKAR